MNCLISCHGFGYGHVNDTYKVLVVVCHASNISEYLTRMYTFGEILEKETYKKMLPPEHDGVKVCS